MNVRQLVRLEQEVQLSWLVVLKGFYGTREVSAADLERECVCVCVRVCVPERIKLTPVGKGQLLRKFDTKFIIDLTSDWKI